MFFVNLALKLKYQSGHLNVKHQCEDVLGMDI